MHAQTASFNTPIRSTTFRRECGSIPILRIGPWFLIGPFVPAKGRYRGAVSTMRLSLAVAFAGEAMSKLIEQAR